MGLVIVVGCGGGETGEETPRPMPLGEGYYWTMVNDTDSNQVWRDSIYAMRGDTALVLEIIDNVSDSDSPESTYYSVYYDGEYLVWRITFDSSAALLDLTPAGEPRDPVYLGGMGESDDPWNLRMFPLDPQVGDHWVVIGDLVFFWDEDDDGVVDTMWAHQEATIIAQEDVSTPAGDFQGAYRVSMEGHYRQWLSSTGTDSSWTERLYDYWVAPGAWMVRYEDWEDGTLYVRYILREYWVGQ